MFILKQIKHVVLKIKVSAVKSDPDFYQGHRDTTIMLLKPRKTLKAQKKPCLDFNLVF
jgi:hypothetical protein